MVDIPSEYNLIQYRSNYSEQPQTADYRALGRDIDDEKIQQGFEQITGACRGYLEFDVEYTTKKEQIANEEKDVRAVIEDVDLLLNAPFVVLTSNGKNLKRSAKGNTRIKWKNSVHVVWDTVYGSGKQLEAWIRSERDDDEWLRKPDFSVYKPWGKQQLFRLPGCSKPSENRPLIQIDPVTLKQIPIEWDKALVTAGVAPLPRPECEIAEEKAVEAKLQRTIAKADMLSRVQEAVFRHIQGMADIDTSAWGAPTYKPNGFINIKRVKPSHCDYHGRVHDADNCERLNVASAKDATREMWNVWRGCTRPDAKTNSSYVISVKHHDNGFKFFVSKRAQSPDDKFKALFASADQSTREELIERERSLFARITDAGVRTSSQYTYMGDWPELVKCIRDAISGDDRFLIAIKKMKGGGKTQLMIRALEGNTGIKVLIPTSRVSLSESLAKALGAVHYKTKAKGNQWVVQLDSTYSYSYDKHPEVILADEVDQLLRHRTSVTFMKQRFASRNINKFNHHMKNARVVIIMDAGLTRHNVEEVRQLMGGDPESIVTSVWWDHKPPVAPVEYYVTRVDTDVVVKTREDIKANRRFWMATNQSKEKAHMMAMLALVDETQSKELTAEKSLSELRKAWRKTADDNCRYEDGVYERKMPDGRIRRIIIVSSETAGFPPVTAFHGNPNEEVLKYDGIVSTPSIQGGVDVNAQDAIHSIYGVFGNNTNTAGDALQQLGRVRYPISRRVLVAVNLRIRETITDKEKLIAYLLAQRTDAIDAIKADRSGAELAGLELVDAGQAEFRNNAFTELYVKHQVQYNLEMRNWLSSFVNTIKLEGHHVELFEPHTWNLNTRLREQKRVRAVTKASKDKTQLDRAKELCADAVALADKMDEEDINKLVELRKSGDATPVEILQITRWYLLARCGLLELAKKDGFTLTPEYMRLLMTELQSKYESGRPFFKDGAGGDFEKGLVNAKKAEVINEAKIRSFDVEREQADELSYVIKSLASDKYHFAKLRAITDALKAMGFTGLVDGHTIPATDIKQTLLKGLRAWKGLNIVNVLGKRPSKRIAFGQMLKKTDSENWVCNALQFINGTLSYIGGCKLGKVGDCYKLLHMYGTVIKYNSVQEIKLDNPHLSYAYEPADDETKHLVTTWWQKAGHKTEPPRSEWPWWAKWGYDEEPSDKERKRIMTVGTDALVRVAA